MFRRLLYIIAVLFGYWFLQHQTIEDTQYPPGESPHVNRDTATPGRLESDQDRYRDRRNMHSPITWNGKY